MKRGAAIGIALAAAMILAAQSTDPLIQKAQKFLEMLNSGDFAGASKEIAPSMTSALPPEKLAEFWKAMPEKLGVLY